MDSVITIRSIMDRVVQNINESKQFNEHNLNAEFCLYDYYDKEVMSRCIRMCIKINKHTSLNVIERYNQINKDNVVMDVFYKLLAWMGTVSLPVMYDVNIYQINNDVLCFSRDGIDVSE